MRRSLSLAGVVVLLWGAMAKSASAQYWNDFHLEPHDYNRASLDDPFSRLLARVEEGEIQLDEKPGKPLVERLLKELGIPESSQIFVFTQTSLQRQVVGPSNPRAIYFNEDVYLGWMPGGRIEVSSVDPKLGPVFYFQRPLDEPEEPLFARTGRCLGCHAGSASNFLPGLMGRSVFPDENGRAIRAVRTFERIGHEVSFADRWGGWFVTGLQHGSLGHMGNAIASKNLLGGMNLDREAGGRIEFDLSSFFPPESHLIEGSDVLALLVHDHQVSMQYFLNQAQYKMRQALFDNGLDPDSGREVLAKLKPVSAEEVEGGVRELLRYLLFADEEPLGGEEIVGGHAYREDFLATRRTTSDGLSLKDLDLKDRLLRHRCSWMIYSGAFEGLPRALKEEVYHQMWAIFTDDEAPEGFDYLVAEEKQALVKILSETKSDLPSYWKAGS